MQTIFKTVPASNFTIIANDFISSNMPPIPFRVLNYLLSQPVNQAYTHQHLDTIIKQLGLTNYARKKALKGYEVQWYEKLR
jgi:hypothetical protein